jgi:tripartite-type tricarboxylate transporter receptor subunit TctC
MRKGLAWCAALAMAAAVMPGGAEAQTAVAQSWPAKSIRIIVPYGNTIIGTQATAQAAPDGYTLLLTNGALSINQSLVSSLPYDLDRDLAPVAWLGESYGLIVVNDKVPARTFPELIKLAKAQPGKIAVAVPGLGTNYRIALEQLKDVTGVPT